MLVKRDHMSPAEGDTMNIEQAPQSSCIFCRKHRCGRQNVQRAQGDVAGCPDRNPDQIESGSQVLLDEIQCWTRLSMPL
jgi:hypothetical protein